MQAANAATNPVSDELAMAAILGDLDSLNLSGSGTQRTVEDTDQTSRIVLSLDASREDEEFSWSPQADRAIDVAVKASLRRSPLYKTLITDKPSILFLGEEPQCLTLPFAVAVLRRSSEGIWASGEPYLVETTGSKACLDRQQLFDLAAETYLRADDDHPARKELSQRGMDHTYFKYFTNDSTDYAGHNEMRQAVEFLATALKRHCTLPIDVFDLHQLRLEGDERPAVIFSQCFWTGDGTTGRDLQRLISGASTIQIKDDLLLIGVLIGGTYTAKYQLEELFEHAERASYQFQYEDEDFITTLCKLGWYMHRVSSGHGRPTDMNTFVRSPYNKDKFRTIVFKKL